MYRQMKAKRQNNLVALSTNTAGQLDILWLDGNTLGMNGTQVSVLKESNEVSLGGLLQGSNSSALESQISLEILRDFSNEALEGELADQELKKKKRKSQQYYQSKVTRRQTKTAK